MLPFVLRLRFIIGFLFLPSSIFFLQAQELKPIQLPLPQMEIGKPLMQVLSNRHSTRSFDSKQLPLLELSNILWAAYGINRPESGHRTVPSAMNWQEYDVYVALKEGIYIYNAKSNGLDPVESGDLREFTGKQDFVKDAPVNLIYVADYSKISKSGKLTEDQKTFSLIDAGFIAQNVYLYCASQDLSVVARGMFDSIKLTEILKLKPEQKVILTQTVGYPIISRKEHSMNTISKKVTGIGGIFFKCKDPGKIKEWYEKNLGLTINEYGAQFEFRSIDNPENKGSLVWSPFKEETKYFEPSKKEFMINYRVDNLELLLQDLKKDGVQILDEVQSYDYGKFVHIMDIEGNKIELWEPKD